MRCRKKPLRYTKLATHTTKVAVVRDKGLPTFPEPRHHLAYLIPCSSCPISPTFAAPFPTISPHPLPSTRLCPTILTLGQPSDGVVPQQESQSPQGASLDVETPADLGLLTTSAVVSLPWTFDFVS
jgi:hypothetical protein